MIIVVSERITMSRYNNDPKLNIKFRRIVISTGGEWEWGLRAS